MKRKLLISALILLPLIVVSGIAYQYRGAVKIETVESPEKVVKRFYSYISEGGPTSLDEAYRLLSTKHYTMSEDSFRNIVTKYPSDMRVTVIDGRIIEDHAVVPIEYKVSSAFGGDFTVKTEVNLDLDIKTRRWKIDFTGENDDKGTEA